MSRFLVNLDLLINLYISFISSYPYTNVCLLCNIPVSLQHMNPASTSVIYTCIWSYRLAPGVIGIPNEDGKTSLFSKNRLLQFKQLLPCRTYGNKNKKSEKKTFGDLETNILCYAKCSFIVTCTKQRWKCKAPWRHVLITFEDAIKIWFEKKCFMSLFWDISQCSLLKYNVSSVWFWHCMSDLFWTDFNFIRLSVVDLQWNKST